MMLLRLILLFIIINFNYAIAADTPVIVIAPSKKAQSASTVGTSVTVLDENFFNNSTESFLGDVLSSTTTSANFFQNGGPGSTSAIQLRGLPKRYTTVYIDGVKMSDPSSVSNDFDFSQILTSSISRVEILKGNQSSVYGSGAIGGTINITTKKGKPGFHKDVEYMTGSNGTHNLAASISGANDTNNFYIGLERYQTDGISAMMHNTEKDRYRNNSVIANYDRTLSDEFEFQARSRVAESYLQYDAVSGSSGYAHNEEQDSLEGSANISLVYKPMENFINKFTVANTTIRRVYADAPESKNTVKDNYAGDRDAYIYSGNYNFNLDNSIVFGYEREVDAVGYNANASGNIDKHSWVNSKYYDYQSRLTQNLYVTLGSRFDEHQRAGTEDSHRVTGAFILDDNLTKLKASYGTGFRYPSIYEEFFVYAANSASLPNVKAENSKSYDFGIEKTFLNKGLKIDLSYFDMEYSDTLEGWTQSSSSGLAFTTANMPGLVKSKGIEFISQWQKSDFLNFSLNYTYTKTYDGAEQDDPNRNSSYFDERMVRVPDNVVNLITNIKFPNNENLDLTINTKWSDQARDYGNGNRTFQDETIDDYMVNDLSINYNLWNQYKLYSRVSNIFDEQYETSRDYSQLGRTFNFGIKRSY